MTFHEKWARVVSLLLNPLVMPSLAFWILFSMQAYFALLLPLQAKLMLMAVIVINTFLLPFLSIFTLKRMGLVTSFSLDRREERNYPLMLGILLMYLTWYLFRKLELPGVFSAFLFGGALVTLLALIINWRWKVSIHMTAIGGVTGMLLALLLSGYTTVLPLLALFAVLSGLVASARLVLGAHTTAQVYAGFLMGLTGLCLTYLLL